jgi:hypothetical protein
VSVFIVDYDCSECSERIRICEARQHLLPLAQSILLQSIMVQAQRERKSHAALRSDELRYGLHCLIEMIPSLTYFALFVSALI